MTEPAPALPPASPEPENEVRLSFMDHLRELRKRLGRALVGIAVGFSAVLWFAKPIYFGVMRPVLETLPEGKRELIFTSLVEPVWVYVKVALYGGIFAAVPWVLWQLWQFVAPGLYRKEKRVVIPFLVSGTTLFYTGAAFCFFVVMPAAFPTMMQFADDAALGPMLTMTEQLSLVLAMLLGFGIVFEVPVVIAFLSMIGLVEWRTLAKYRRYAVVVNLVAAAIITPTGDPLNLALMAVPMIVFYEIGILAARILGKRPEAGTTAKADA
jgi:sec-independent protein translocase protein TatC